MPYGNLLMFFAIPLVMMGFPGIKSIELQQGVVKIDKLTHDLQQHPTDAAKRAELNQTVSQVSSRPVADPNAIASIARAQFALGDHKAAEANLKKVMQKAPELPQV